MPIKPTTNGVTQDGISGSSPPSSSTGTGTGGHIDIPSGFKFYRSHMIIGFIALTVTYFAVMAVFDDVLQPWMNLPPSSPELCSSSSTTTTSDVSQPCWRSDLFSFEVTSGIALIWSAWIGFYCWHVSGNVHRCGTTRDSRLFGYLPEGHALTAIGTTFQLFDLFVSFMIPEMRQWIFLCHHIMAATVSWFGLNNQYFHYYGGTCTVRCERVCV
jgi:hypothetical protein